MIERVIEESAAQELARDDLRRAIISVPFLKRRHTAGARMSHQPPRDAGYWPRTGVILARPVKNCNYQLNRRIRGESATGNGRFAVVLLKRTRETSAINCGQNLNGAENAASPGPHNSKKRETTAHFCLTGC